MIVPLLLAFVLGIFSMGFQLLGSRMLSPWFGSSIVVWAFLISTFLAAFSVGSVLGGLVARRRPSERRPGLYGLVGLMLAGFLLNALAGRLFLGWIDTQSWAASPAMATACLVLFFPPICGMAALTPILVQQVSESGQQAGYASGLIYCIGTFGNIAGIMLTVFLLIPALPLSVLLWIWVGGVGVSSLALLRFLRG